VVALVCVFWVVSCGGASLCVLGGGLRLVFGVLCRVWWLLSCGRGC